MKRILVINGPNINLLGMREPDIYGRGTYADLVADIRAWAEELGLYVRCVQSNHEGDIVDYIQAAIGEFDGIVINPAAYTHTSVAIFDALKGSGIPSVEVHISDPTARESFRHVSYAGLACVKTVKGKGFLSYREALEFFCGEKHENAEEPRKP